MEQVETRHLACRFCIALYGLHGQDISLLPIDRAVMEEHIESAHHYLMRREREILAQAHERFRSLYGQEPQGAAQILARLGDTAALVADIIDEKGPVISVRLERSA